MQVSAQRAARYCFAEARRLGQPAAIQAVLLTRLQAAHHLPTQPALVEMCRFRGGMLLAQVLLRGAEELQADLPIAAQQPEMRRLLEVDALARRERPER